MSDSQNTKTPPPIITVDVQASQAKRALPKLPDFIATGDTGVASRKVVLNYLKQFGHASETMTSTDVDKLSVALKSFQEFARIPPRANTMRPLLPR